MQLDELMTKSIIQIEAYYIMLIYKYFFDFRIQNITTEDLPFAFSWYIEKMKRILEALLQKEATMFVSDNEIDKEKGEIVILFDFLVNFCGTSSESIIQANTPNPDSKNYKESQERENEFCNNIKWAIGRLVQAYTKIINSMNLEDSIQQCNYSKSSIN